ncbi:glycosyltransferase family 2 protein [Yinghuangia soli]|uniref:Glycosyltransferase family 2 protein n=1 Tax=Yinghuangia soli TaxID=2908204 RepID=A0AA41PXP3_9ACTN|nr:glycosyltransferase family 2 protein [Yinghuangia soli]MCF2527270.1 glycosyltransferase family 2 protein [Yinghuangia soli]
MIKVTVVVPAHNSGEAILVGLEALRRQSLPDHEYEVIYVNDGSTDDTGTILEKHTAGLHNFRVLHIPNSGWPGKPRNLGIEEARGEFIYFVDDDDWIEPESLERLYNKAVANDSDIVVPKMVGHGRSAPRETTSYPLDAGHVVTHPILLGSMSVLKLFRRSFLLENHLRFAEEKVRLEDDMFMLRAHLAARRVSVLHDYTCYHSVRNEGFGNISFSKLDPFEYFPSVGMVFDIIDQHLAPGTVRDSFIARWYHVKMLNQLDERILRHERGYYLDIYRVILDLVNTRIPPHIDSHLPANLRVRSAVLRSGDPDLMLKLAAWEANTNHQPRIESIGWRDGSLHVAISSDLARFAKDGTADPVRFLHRDGRILWDLPSSLLAVPGVAEARDVTDLLETVKMRPFVRYRDVGGDLFVPKSYALAWRPLGHNAQGEQTFALRVDGQARIDPLTTNHGAPISGIWDVFVLVEAFGWGKTRRLGDNRNKMVDAQVRPAFLGPHGVFVNPYWTKPYSNLSLTVDSGSLNTLRGAAREIEEATVTGTPHGVAVSLPLEVAPLAAPVSLLACLTDENKQTVRIPALLTDAHPPASPRLDFTVPAHVLNGRGPCRLSVEYFGRGGDLGLSLAPDRTPGSWYLTR